MGAERALRSGGALITVLTPTYNRAHTLGRLFESLRAQTDTAFEWLVVDDGSTDETRALIENCMSKVEFSVRYFRQENGGKQSAVNTGVRLAHGDWIFIVDSDDALTSGAVEVSRRVIAENSGNAIVGVCFRKAYFDGSIVGVKGEGGGKAFLHPTRAARRFKGDLAYIFPTAALKRHAFPVFEGEKFIPELYIWNKIGDEGKIIFFLDVAIYLCEYLADGYSATFKSNLRRNPNGFRLFYIDQFFREKSYLAKMKCALRATQCFIYSAAARVRL